MTSSDDSETNDNANIEPAIIEVENAGNNEKGAVRLVIGILFTMDVMALVTFGASFSAFVDDEWSQWTLTLSSSLAIVFWGSFLLLSCYAFWRHRHNLECLLGWTRNLSILGLILMILTGILFALGALSSCGPYWLSIFYHTVGFIGTLCFALVWCLLPRAVRSFVAQESSAIFGPNNKHMRPVRRWVACMVLFGTWVAPFSTLWFFAWAYFVNVDIDTSNYPDASVSPYRLPFPTGDTAFLLQGNGGKFSHTDALNRYSFDFFRPCGTPIIASRPGIVGSVQDSFHGNVLAGNGQYNNYVNILHEDGTTAGYLHLEQGSVLVKPGDEVNQGSPIAKVGNVGRSSAPHIHFVVYNAGWGRQSIPVSFHDVKSDGGILRALRFYQSGNEEDST